MIAFWTRASLSGLLIAAASTIARRQPSMGALIVSLPLVSVLSMIWLWRDQHDPAGMARYVGNTLWYFLPSMPMFLLIPMLLRRGVDFWPSLIIGCVTTVLLYLGTVWLGARFGLDL